ncbi:GNAT family N-acetyltransferase [Pseudonocardia sp. NPDC049154]|uniref:GNAT family N-acetyltransferase n=1 Tax=Pseudonocardia sp. NPDC049154 TaxID=3155501 RepID=UPI0033FD3283
MPATPAGLSGPRPDTDPDATALGTLWTVVTRAGGAVGFPPDAPETDVRALAEATVAEVRAGTLHLLALHQGGDELVGTVFLQPGRGPVVAHRATVIRLMVRPDLQGRGLGGRLLDAAVTRAAELGLAQLILSARGGTGLPAWYAARGWTEVGRVPGALRLGPGDVRDEHWFQREIVADGIVRGGTRNRQESVGPSR